MCAGLEMMPESGLRWGKSLVPLLLVFVVGVVVDDEIGPRNVNREE